MKGEWNNMILAMIIVLIVLGILLFFWANQGQGVMAFINDLFNIGEKGLG